ncbi:Na+/H+ antiporter NhaC family protein [Salinicoccus sp. ID82-1]|uniref:Na+/H+ antiporter NhaC family protein n=1 Tax=Salinicoccus sp. ID82-1 TaxID=2820269 RepID=UPI001F2E2221|nr:Na+/H+ antiporter NhaC family protein [Salinicoccus sp. ID82-1]
MEFEAYGMLSLLPVIIAILLAFVTKNVILSLFLGALTGVFIINGLHPIDSVTTFIGDYVFVQLTDNYNAAVIALLVFIGGFVSLMEKSGGAMAFAKSVSKYINTRMKAKFATWFGGIIIFFSDIGTPLIVGPIFESTYDKLKISREKLAWILDSTATPVAVLIPFIGWGIYIMGLINEEFERLGIAESDFSAYMNAWPYFVYPILAVLIVPVVILMKKDFGPMRTAEKRTVEGGERYWPNAAPLRQPAAPDLQTENNSRPVLIWLPLAVLFVTLFGLLIPEGFPFEAVSGSTFRVALSTAYLFASITLIILMLIFKVHTFKASFEIYTTGMQRMLNVIVIIVLAWAIGMVLEEMGTANYIVQVIDDNIPLSIIPMLIFIVGAVMAFASGTSWGTFAIMLPIAIPIAAQLDISIYICIGAVISAGIFGDHCSPISDSTILSSTGAGSDHIDHVKTQLPMALLNGAITVIALFVGTLTDSPLVVFGAIILMIISVFIMSRLPNKKTVSE